MAVAGTLTYDTKLDTKGFKKGVDSLESAANTAMKGVATAIAGVVTGITAIGIASVKSYADLEQNIGGIETLFKGSADTVIKNANNAYKTAGMSANQYMQTVTGFSASLLQSLGGDTEKASEVSNMALIDMSDNANKMGTSMESIQFAYQGFAKQNYTLLDNLKLGYGGTQEEMKRLLNDAEKLTGVKYDITNLNDVFQAVHAIQGELEITGTTAKEAEETISGSMSSMKSALDNFLNGSGTFDQLLETAKIAFKNIADAVGELLPRMAEEIVNSIPQEWIDNIKNITPFLVIIGTALGVIWGYFKAVAIIQAVSEAFTVLNTVLMANPILLIVALIAGLVLGFIYLWNTSEDFRNFWIDLWEGIKSVFETVWNLISKFFTETIPGWINGIIEWFKKLPGEIWNALVNAFNNIVNWLSNMYNKTKESISNLINNIIEWFKKLPDEMAKVGKNIVDGIWNGITGAKDWILNKIKGFAHSITQGIKDFFQIKSPSKVMANQVGKFIPQGIAVGIEADTNSALNAIDDMNNDIMSKMNKAVAYETGSINASASVKANNSMLNVVQATFNIDGSVQLDGQKAGRLMTPYISKTLVAGGAY